MTETEEGVNRNAGDGERASDAPVLVACGCGVHDDDAEAEAGAPRKAVAVDAEIKERAQKRLRRIEGQVRGLQRMLEEDRYCADVLTQISSVQEALRGVGRELLRNHLKHCAATAIRAGGDEADAMYDELIDVMYKNLR